ncbi:type VII secretion protein EssC [Lactococcus allomyrinae]|uniref:Type VII secretion protein EssC n=1 Tax=Lactococcus allomyrinae TaxID=2419773 RepID=A0A387BHW3_9LACT|nr:type VII secretion protein EssC [Lactococcus allomyrinae]AYG00470.1 type VII secretion protein EssC [Lactococcus allomyrinae]
MSDIGFEIIEEAKEQQLFLDNRLDASDTLFVIYLLSSQLHTITLSEHRPSITYQDKVFSSFNDELFINGNTIPKGYSKLENLNDLEVFVISPQSSETTFFIINEDEHFVIGSDEIASFKTQGNNQVVIHKDSFSVDAKEDFLYFNNVPLKGHHYIKGIQAGFQILTPDFLLEKRPTQWKITNFSNHVTFAKRHFLRQSQAMEFPEDFPKYRRSPRVHLEPPEDKFKIQKIEAQQKANKNGILKAILPPIGMLAVTGITSVLSGRNPLMMLGMGFMSIITATFTVSQYINEKKERKVEEKNSKENYDFYLTNTNAEISRKYTEETRVLNFRNPSPEALTEMISTYNSRIYERMANNKDFLEISLGEGNQPSHLKIDSDLNERDTDENTLRVKKLIEYYSTQRAVPTTLNLATQTLGLVGTYPVLKTAVSNLLLQVAFFHSYRDVNFISLVPEKNYKKDWGSWRVLPHFKLQELGMRGLIHNAKTRDIVLSSFYQLLNKRKQVLQDAGKEKPQFSPHYILTIFDDSYLAGHGINEFLAEDMSNLGVTVIWAKEDQKLLPETVTALVEYKNQSAGEIINDNNVHVAKTFEPYDSLSNIEKSLRLLSNLEHVEVEKNAIPESLSLLEQYEVKTIEDLSINERWEKAQPNKSIKSLIGWRGKKEYMYWDLHERVHGPHALVGGTTGSGKSEFLTTYLIGLAINFSPEDIGMLIIDWKGGGIANTLAGLPHFMGSITNLDGAGTARALASIKAELDKRMKEFAKFGVNNINGYMSLYKSRLNPKPDVKYPEQPIPHLILVSDEFAELKSNVPEFLDELTSVARIGRSLGVHLILATQKPSGVVNDQIEANSTSKIALKMASEQDSNELLKTHDAAHITQPGRGYLKVGQNEVYELFQSGYAGIPYDPNAIKSETVDERINRVTELGQTEIAYDPGEEIIQGQDTSDLPTQLEAVIEGIQQIFEDSGLTLPAKPWLPNLETQLVTPKITTSSEINTKIPLGLLDVPSRQSQEVYIYNIIEASHTVIFSSPGYGKSTTLQTIVMNLARQNTPNHVQFNLLDFGNNGLLPLKDLPHVADLVTIEENEKLTKMLARMRKILSERKQTFKKEGVATLSQYQQKTKQKLPIIVNLLDNYDALAQSKRRDEIDEILIQVLRDGAAVGVYLILTAGRFNAIRMNMMSNIQTKIALFMNDENEISNLFGRERLEQSEIIGRGQMKLDFPVALQIYLPTTGKSDMEVLETMSQEIDALNQNWKGERPDAIPMVPEELTQEVFKTYLPRNRQNRIYLGLNKGTSKLEDFELFRGRALGIFSENVKQAKLLLPFVLGQIISQNNDVELDILDSTNLLERFADDAMLYFDKEVLNKRALEVKEALQSLSSGKTGRKLIVFINGLADIVEKAFLKPDEIVSLLTVNKENIQIIVADTVTRIGNSYGGTTNAVKENVYQILFGGDLSQQHFIENLSQEIKKEVTARNVIHSLKDDEFFNIVFPTEQL